LPRKSNSKALSDGWKKLHKFQKMELSKKITRSHKILEKNIKRYENPVVCWSGGKDSTVALHLALQFDPDIQVIHIDTGVLFPETTKFIEKLSEKWELNIRIVKSNPEKYWEICEKYGWPIFGKAISSNVGRAFRTGNIRDQLSRLEKILIQNKVKLSMKCAEYLLDKPTKQIEKELNADLKIIGIRALESRARVRLWVDYGDLYYVKRYYKRNEGIWKLSPISIWSEEDIWKYNELNNIPHNKLYDMGFDRNGCWTCAMAIRRGQINKLKKYNIDLYNELMYNSDMGKQIAKSYEALLENKNVIGFKLDIFDPILEDINKLKE